MRIEKKKLHLKASKNQNVSLCLKQSSQIIDDLIYKFKRLNYQVIKNKNILFIIENQFSIKILCFVIYSNYSSYCGVFRQKFSNLEPKTLQYALINIKAIYLKIDINEILQKVLYPILVLILIVNSQKISKKCICGHVQSQADCENSGFCIWSNECCSFNFNFRGTQPLEESEEINQQCKIFAEEDCRIQLQCGFHQGYCSSFIDCKFFSKEYCQQSSHRCVSDGKQCVEKLECNDYKTEIGCYNQNKDGHYCIWIQTMEKKCQSISICEELPIYLMSHTMCKEGLDGCTVDEKGYGCIKLRGSCNEYFNDFQCFESNSQINNCFWDDINKKCIEKNCENLPFKQDHECKSYLSECKEFIKMYNHKRILNYIYYTSNGIHCIIRKQCSDVQNKNGCVTYLYENKCVFHQNQCKIKACDTALVSLTNYQQCQNYVNLLDCVTSENGGCKQRPLICEGYVGQVDCYSIAQEDCVWYHNQCVKRECQHAPEYYGQKDCMQYGNCIGKLGDGCQDTVEICEQILQEQFCEFNQNKEICIWLDGACTLLECIRKIEIITIKN